MNYGNFRMKEHRGSLDRCSCCAIKSISWAVKLQGLGLAQYLPIDKGAVGVGNRLEAGTTREATRAFHICPTHPRTHRSLK